MLEGKAACDRGEEKQVEKHLRVSVTGYADEFEITVLL